MRHKIAGKKLGRTSTHRIALGRNMVCSLIHNERITTTMAKAKWLRRHAEKVITLVKRNGGDTPRTRYLIGSKGLLPDKTAVDKLFKIVPRFNDRNGGYTRVLRLGHRAGDKAEMAMIEYLDNPLTQDNVKPFPLATVPSNFTQLLTKFSTKPQPLALSNEEKKQLGFPPIPKYPKDRPYKSYLKPNSPLYIGENLVKSRTMRELQWVDKAILQTQNLGRDKFAFKERIADLAQQYQLEKSSKARQAELDAQKKQQQSQQQQSQQQKQPQSQQKSYQRQPTTQQQKQSKQAPPAPKLS